MRARSLTELSEFLDQELSRRKRELMNLDAIITISRDHQLRLLRRAAIVLLYSHWEGFVKSAGTAYIEYVRSQRLPYDRLKPNLVGASLKSEIEALIDTNRSTLITAVVRRFTELTGATATFDWRGELDTRSNLNSDVLGEILCLLGFDHTPYETKKVFLDAELLGTRNEIAHGEHVEVDRGSYEQTRDIVLQLLEQFRIDVENAAVRKSYLR